MQDSGTEWEYEVCNVEYEKRGEMAGALSRVTVLGWGE